MTTKITFLLESIIADNADTAILLGEFNNWDITQGIQLEKQADGSFKAIIDLEENNTYHYRYLLNNGTWVNDGNANGYIYIPNYNIDNCIKTVATAPKKIVKKQITKIVDKVEATVKSAKAKKTSSTSLDKKITVKKSPKAKVDSLELIEGIGKKIASILHAEKIITFNDLANTNTNKLKEILSAAGPRYNVHVPDSWPAQAKLAAKGQLAELAILQAKLKGGK